VFERALRADFALLRGHRADSMGNVTYNKTARNYSPVMAMAAATTVVEVNELVEVGGLDPEEVVTPCIFVKRVVLNRGAA
jgi:3-oxoadipate CoA-transferase alpha subunit